MDEAFYEMEAKTCWAEFDSKSAEHWSAVGYVFAKELAQKLGVTVGVIGCNWGGTLASCWMSEEAIREDKDLAVFWDEYYPALEGKSEEEQVKEFKAYETYHAAWDKECGKLYTERPGITWDEVQAISYNFV